MIEPLKHDGECCDLSLYSGNTSKTAILAEHRVGLSKAAIVSGQTGDVGKTAWVAGQRKTTFL